MNELDITTFFNNAAPMDYSASVAEIGNNAGIDTWTAANDDSEDYFILDTEEKRDSFRVYVRGLGGWTDEEINEWTDIQLNAILIQMISGDMRAAGLHADMTVDGWQEYAAACESGQCSGNIYGGSLCIPEFQNRVFYSIG